jgi:uncharacterized protein (DUF58 family)
MIRTKANRMMRSPYWFISVLAIALFFGLSVLAHNGSYFAVLGLGLFTVATFGSLLFLAISPTTNQPQQRPPSSSGQE